MKNSCTSLNPAEKMIRTSAFSTALISVLTMFIAVTYAFGLYVFPTMLTDMQSTLQFDYGVAGLLNGLSQIGFVTMSVLVGWMSRRIGAGWLIALTMFVCSISLFLIGLNSSVMLLGLLLFVLGACASSIWSPMIDIVEQFVSKPHQGKILGTISSGSNLGFLANGLITPYFLGQNNWRSLWFLLGGIGLAVAILGVILLKKGYLLATSRSQAQVHQPHGHLTKMFVILALIGATNGFAGRIVTTYLSAFMHGDLALNAEAVGLVWVVIGISGLISGVLMGTVADQIGVKRVLFVALIAHLGAIVLMIYSTTLLPFIAVGVLISFGFIAVFGLVPAYIAKTASAAHFTSLFGFCNVCLGLSSILGNYLGGFIRELSGTFIWSYWLAFATVILAILLTMLLPPERIVQR